VENENDIDQSGRQNADAKYVSEFLTTEHLALQTARSALVSDSNKRTSVYLNLIGFAIVSIAFISQISGAAGGPTFYVFTLVLFPSLLFLGLVSFLRELQTAMKDFIYARDINRIQYYYVKIEPEMRDYFVRSNIDTSHELPQRAVPRPSLLQHLATATGTILVINSIITAVWFAILARYLFAPPLWLTAFFAVFVFVVAFAIQQIYQTRAWEDFEAELMVNMPGPPAI
jgi:hypothetical protein